MKRYVKHKDARDLRENGRIILARGEVTGHVHEVLDAMMPGVSEAEYFEEPGGRKMLLSMSSRPFVHEEHGRIELDPAAAARGATLLSQGVQPGTKIPGQYRQGDVLLQPCGFGAWEVIPQREYAPDAIRVIAD